MHARRYDIKSPALPHSGVTGLFVKVSRVDATTLHDISRLTSPPQKFPPESFLHISLSRHQKSSNVCETDDLKFPLVGTKDEMKEISVILLVMRA